MHGRKYYLPFLFLSRPKHSQYFSYWVFLFLDHQAFQELENLCALHPAREHFLFDCRSWRSIKTHALLSKVALNCHCLWKMILALDIFRSFYKIYLLMKGMLHFHDAVHFILIGIKLLWWYLFRFKLKTFHVFIRSFKHYD